MYNDLYSYIVYRIFTNSTSSGICNPRWIYGIIITIIVVVVIVIIVVLWFRMWTFMAIVKLC